jgi:hypothetical protein
MSIAAAHATLPLAGERLSGEERLVVLRKLGASSGVSVADGEEIR